MVQTDQPFPFDLFKRHPPTGCRAASPGSTTEMSRSGFLGATAAGAALSLVFAGAATAQPELPSCKNKQKVSLVINTDTTSGWTVNGAPVVVVSNGGWANASPAAWIGPTAISPPATLTYKVTFATPYLHGPMSVQARWAADNCGQSLKAGSGPLVSTGACAVAPAPNGKDFLAFNHVTSAQFAQADSTGTTASLVFVVSNVKWSPAGLAGIFTITANCVLS